MAQNKATRPGPHPIGRFATTEGIRALTARDPGVFWRLKSQLTDFIGDILYFPQVE